MRVKYYLSETSKILDQGWLSRIFLVAQFYLAYAMTTWAMAFGSTSLAMKADLLGAAAVIAAVAAAPQALLMLATNKYMEMRNEHYNSRRNRRKEDNEDLYGGGSV